MSQFQELLDQLTAESEEQSALAKSLPAAEGEDDKAIQAAAEENDLLDPDFNPEDLDPEDNDEDEDNNELDLDPKLMAKSMQIDGEEYDVIDAEELVKSMQDLSGRVSEQESVLAKALGSTLGMVKQQGEMIKSLNARLNNISKQGAGRKTVLAIHDKPPVGEQLTKSNPDQMTAGDVLAKAHAAFGAGKINGLELTTIDVSLRQNEQIDQGLLAKALS